MLPSCCAFSPVTPCGHFIDPRHHASIAGIDFVVDFSKRPDIEILKHSFIINNKLFWETQSLPCRLR